MATPWRVHAQKMAVFVNYLVVHCRGKLTLNDDGYKALKKLGISEARADEYADTLAGRGDALVSHEADGAYVQAKDPEALARLAATNPERLLGL